MTMIVLTVFDVVDLIIIITTITTIIEIATAHIGFLCKVISLNFYHPSFDGANIVHR